MSLVNPFAEVLHEEEHARLSPSGSKKWFACPGSLTLERPIPNKSSTYADDGTAMHTVAAWCLTQHYRAARYVGQYIEVQAKGEEIRKVQFDDDMAELVQGYVDQVRVLGIGNKMFIEKRVEFSSFIDVPNQFGTADATIVNERDGELMVIDLKTGHTPVEVEKNSQLMFYALGVLHMLLNEESQPAIGVSMHSPGEPEDISDDDEDLF